MLKTDSGYVLSKGQLIYQVGLRLMKDNEELFDEFVDQIKAEYKPRITTKYICLYGECEDDPADA
jgi:hypothetical protein